MDHKPVSSTGILQIRAKCRQGGKGQNVQTNVIYGWPKYLSSYYDNINKLADLLALERHNPMDNAIWLLEYVAATKGAEPLKPASRHLSTAQYLSLDVIAFLAIVAYFAAKLARKCWHRDRQQKCMENYHKKKD